MSIAKKKKRLQVTTYSKVVFLLSIISIGFLATLFLLFRYTLQQEKQIFKNANELYNNEIKSLLDLNAESFISIISDVTYWNEFVTFINTKDINWFDTSVANLIDTYKIDYICAYDLNGNYITKVATPKIKSNFFIPKESFPKIYNEKLNRFYMKIPDGIVEVFGATIHPSNDPFKNKTKPKGYFFMVRLLDPEYYANLEKISSSKITIYSGSEPISKTVYSIVPLNSYTNKNVAKLLFKSTYSIDFSITKRILLIIVIAIFLSMIVMFYYARRWAGLPLSLIKKVLEKSDQGAIDSLKKIKGEFRYIGKLFEKNQLQKKQLELAKSKAEESDTLKSAFLTNLSHEIRTPMNAVIGFSDLLENPTISENEKVEYRRIINKSGKNLVRIIDDLIEMSRIDTKQVLPLYSDFDLNECIEKVFTVLKKSNYYNNTIEFNLIKKSPNFSKIIISDRNKLEKILKNIILNALKFTEKGKIEVSYSVNESENKIEIEIFDTGIGIESHNEFIVFNRFRKVQNDHTIRGGGLGLGLTIAKEYVSMLGGSINVESEIGKGSKFTIKLPLLLDKKASNLNLDLIVKQEEDKNKTIETVLVAEDDNFNFLLVEKILKLGNYRIIRAENGEKAVSLCAENNEIDLVLMDVKMPILDGYEAYKKIKETRPNLPIIAQTAYTSTEEVEKIFKLGFSAYISKPLKKEKLYDVIKNIEKM